MILGSVELEGFKCWSGAREVPLAPITVILGPNSVGKSALVQGSLVLGQSLRRGELLPRRLAPRGRFADLGSVSNIVSAGSHDSQIRLGFQQEDGFGLSLVFDGQHGSDGELSTVELLGQKGERLVCNVIYGEGSPGPTLVPRASAYAELARLPKEATALARMLSSDENGSLQASITPSPESFTVDFTSSEPLEPQVQRLVEAQRESSSADITLADVLRTLVRNRVALMGGLVDRLCPIGPARVRGARAVEVDDGLPSHWVGLSGERLVQVLHAQGEPCIAQVNRWLSMLRVPYALEVVEGGQATTTLEPLLASIEGPTHRVGIPDVGFGISQVLPLLVQMAAVDEGIVTVEQPEIHLHPAVQARLAAVIADWVGTAERGLRQVIIETHSEHMVLAMQGLLANGPLSASDVALLSVSRGHSQPRLTNIEIDENGVMLTAWPGGFFPERERLIFTGDVDPS